MTYNFSTLSYSDFEDLVRDLIGRELGVRFEAFAVGPDQGLDGRHAVGDDATVIQAKHTVGSPYSSLKSTMQRERLSIDRLAPKRYILATSRPLTPPNKADLATIIGSALQSKSDILGPGDLNGLLRKFPEVEKSHIKLWLTSVAVLERILRSAIHTYTDITIAEIAAKVRVYAPNPSLAGARVTLESHHIVIISGPPGVGKTTLAEMLSYAYLAEGWDLVAIRSLEDGIAKIDDTKPQIFFFDDFLGRIALDKGALAHKDSELSRFMKRIRTSPNARFILTTRAYIFEQARQVSEYMADPGLNISRYVLDVGIYTRRIKAVILYNHLLIAGTPQPHINALVTSGKIGRIIDHRNYNPRIVEWMTDASHLAAIESQSYPDAFLNGLNHPRRLWDIAFRTHISRTCQHMLFALFFCSQYGTEISDLKVAYDALHPHMCAKYGNPFDPKDFEETLKVLEGGFISLRGKQVAFVNPSLRDYLAEYLNDVSMLQDFAPIARRTNWAKAVWEHGKGFALSPDELKDFALSFLNIASEFGRLPVERRIPRGEGYVIESVGLSNIDRIELLLTWWEASQDQRFADFALALSQSPIGGLDGWRDGRDAVELIGQLRDGDYFTNLSHAPGIADYLEAAMLDLIKDGTMSVDTLDLVLTESTLWRTQIGPAIPTALDEAIRDEVANVRYNTCHLDSESELTEHIETMRKLAARCSIATTEVEIAVSIINERIAEIEEHRPQLDSPSFSGDIFGDPEKFDDIALRNLFMPLIQN